MNFAEMCKIEPELGRLEVSAQFAGEHGAAWSAWWAAADQALTKAVGSGAVREELQHHRFYEVALRHLHAAWAGRPVDAEEVHCPWEAGAWGEDVGDYQQSTFLDTSDLYQ